MEDKGIKISEALELLALSLGESGAVPVPELVRALERAAERLRTRNGGDPGETPDDLVTQAEASRTIGVSRQAVNQWVRKGALRTYTAPDTSGRAASRVSLAEVAIVANRRSPAQLSAGTRRELSAFLELLADTPARGLADDLRRQLDDEATQHHADAGRVLREFVIAAMDTGDRQREFTAEGVRLLSHLDPAFPVDRDSPLGHLAASLDLLVTSSRGVSGFDSPSTALLGLLGVATVGTQFSGADTEVGRAVADAARAVWQDEWPLRVYDAAYHVGELRPSPLTRYTSSLTYLDNHRFLRQAQASGVSIAYSRGPGPLLPVRFYGRPILSDILTGDRPAGPVWAFTSDAATSVGRPTDNDSGANPFRVFNYEFGLLDRSIHGIRRYCFSAADARSELRATVSELPMSARQTYLRAAADILARTLAQDHVELVSIETESDFDWWKDHIIRSSPAEILIGLRDEQARRVAHALLVQTSMLPDVVEAADSDGSLRDRLRIYVKNLEFDVVDARYRDDLRRGVARLIKPGGQSLSPAEALALAEEQIAHHLR